METIREFQGEYRWLSNFTPARVVYMGIAFGTVEQAYQAAKCANREDMLQFITLTASGAKKTGRKVAMRPDFDKVKLSIMEDLVQQKFNQWPDKQKLIATGDAELIEGNWWKDYYWGVCNGVGENHLGKIIMKVRAELCCDDWGKTHHFDNPEDDVFDNRF